MKNYTKPVYIIEENENFENVFAFSGNPSIVGGSFVCPKGRKKKTNGCKHNASGSNRQCFLYEECPL